MKELESLLPPKNFQDSIINDYAGLTQIQLISFIVGCYHHKSPFNVITNFIERRFKLAEVCEFPKNDNTYEHESILLGNDELVNKAIIKFLKLFHSPDYSTIVIYKDQLDDCLFKLKNINSIISDAKEQKILEETRKILLANRDTLADDIERLQEKFLQSDNSRELLMELYQSIEEEVFPTTENIAHRLHEGKSALGNYNPYI